ncbi:tetratricopeptide repeat protein (macronuclear) [Tetrahymena thermophila SB210]|uniref:Tetratricopeptide repeat protein n=1 Tax=Tetrahymena thermophila (strain SB210) TaxID=312017 RepID=Q22V89_TETTS|nr:tetratricopeptide repeat protein [Tetrahymena thermophila SB210]EAR89196.2 tetratricopeptide repeat protein [Tetrahymena thermophila SB210]|eukprot:XP_001009441.2 tetratricopeptide repeat protein [Tetrahymena thermophila SB210]
MDQDHQGTENNPNSDSINQYQEIIDSIKSGIEAFKSNDEDQAIINYLEAILSIEDEKENEKLTQQQRDELQQLEIRSRNYFAEVKAHINDFHSVIIQSETVLKLDPTNSQAKFMLAKGLHKMNKFEKAFQIISELKEQTDNINNREYLELYSQCEKDLQQYIKEGKKEEQQNYNINKYNLKMGSGIGDQGQQLEFL